MTAGGRVLIGDCRQALAELPKKSVHVCVTSPPYWGLRDYGSEGQIGLERTPEEYIAHLVEAFRAVRQVLRDDGACWLNLGDSYAREGGDGAPGKSARVGTTRSAEQRRNMAPPTGLKPGDLVGIPWRVALALQADGWYLRSDVIWAKRNTMPESVAGWRWERCRVKVASAAQTFEGYAAGVMGAGQAGTLSHRAPDASGGVVNAPKAEWEACPGCPKCQAADGYVLRRGSWRPTKAHEMVFMLAKSERYFADGEAVREAMAPASAARYAYGFGGEKNSTIKATDNRTYCVGDRTPTSGRNLRDVWTLASQPSKLRHFAMMPPALVEKCILSGPEKVCGACGAPWARVVEKEARITAGRREMRDLPGRASYGGGQRSGTTPGSNTRGFPEYSDKVLGFRPTCTCGAPAVPPLILDPFLGAGTVAGVAEVLGRRWAGCELSAEYAALVPQRIEEVRAYFARRAERRETRRRAPPVPSQQSLFGGAA